jgi:DUF2934 family protein
MTFLTDFATAAAHGRVGLSIKGRTMAKQSSRFPDADNPTSPTKRRTGSPRARLASANGGEDPTQANAIASDRPAASGFEPSEEDIRLRAYQRYLDRGAAHGTDFDDWIEAERELRAPRNQKARL